MNPDEILTISMGETAIGQFGKDNLSRLALSYEPARMMAELYVSLFQDSRDAQLRILDRFADVQAIFEDEVEMNIHLVSPDSSIFEDVRVKELAVSK